MSINPKFDADNVSIAPIALRDVNTRHGDTRRKAAHGLVAALYAALIRWHTKRESRRSLRSMTREQLLDIGLSPAEAAKELRKSYFWD